MESLNQVIFGPIDKIKNIPPNRPASIKSMSSHSHTWRRRRNGDCDWYLQKIHHPHKYLLNSRVDWLSAYAPVWSLRFNAMPRFGNEEERACPWTVFSVWWSLERTFSLRRFSFSRWYNELGPHVRPFLWLLLFVSFSTKEWNKKFGKIKSEIFIVA